MNRTPPHEPIMRIISAVIIAGSLYLYFGKTEDIPSGGNGFTDNKAGKEYSLISMNEYSLPPYDGSVLSLFTGYDTAGRELAASQKRETAIVKPAPALFFIGVVENENGRIYSFRNRDTGKIIFLKEGGESGDITLTGIEDDRFIMSAKNHTFTAAKQ